MVRESVASARGLITSLLALIASEDQTVARVTSFSFLLSSSFLDLETHDGRLHGAECWDYRYNNYRVG